MITVDADGLLSSIGLEIVKARASAQYSAPSTPTSIVGSSGSSNSSSASRNRKRKAETDPKLAHLTAFEKALMELQKSNEKAAKNEQKEKQEAAKDLNALKQNIIASLKTKKKAADALIKAKEDYHEFALDLQRRVAIVSFL
jgi:hypothetical protein